jgi:hypothetical protein
MATLSARRFRAPRVLLASSINTIAQVAVIRQQQWKGGKVEKEPAERLEVES